MRIRGRASAALLALTLVLAAATAPRAQEPDEDRWKEVAAALGDLADPARSAAALERLARTVLELRPLAEEGSEPTLYGGVAFVRASITLAAYPAEARPGTGTREELLEHALTVAERIGQQNFAAEVQLLRSRWLYEEGQLGAAVTLIRTALEAYEEAYAFRPALRQRLTLILRRQARWDEALQELASAEKELEEKAGELRPEHVAAQRAGLCGERAQVWQEQGVLDLAAFWLDEEGRFAEASCVPTAVAVHRVHEVEFALISANFRKAVDVAEKALELEALVPSLRALLLVELGVGLSELGRVDAGRHSRAVEVLEQALESEHLGGTERFRAELALAELALRARDWEGAEKRLASGRGAVDRWRAADADFSLDYAALLVAYESQLARERPAQEGEAPESEEAQRERLGRQEKRLQGAYDELLDDWRNTPKRRGGLGFLNLKTRREVLSQLVLTTLALDDGPSGVEEALRQVVRAQSLGTLARTQELEPPSLATIRRRLGREGRGFLVYLPAVTTSHVFALDRERVAHFRLAPAHRLNEVIEALKREARRPLGTIREDEADAHAGRLAASSARAASELLPREVQEHIESWSALTLVGADLLRHVPFESLELESGALVGEAYAVDVLPSFPVGIYLVGRERTRRDAAFDLTVLATLESEVVLEGDKKVRNTHLEDGHLEPLTRHYERSRVETLVNERLTLERLKKARLSSAGVVHFLVHGIYDADRQFGASLVLADGLLRFEDVERLEVGEVVILSACGTALGPYRLGDDSLAHLGGAFLSAGARCVILSRAQLDYRKTMDLMEAMHEHLAAGDAPAEALRAARASRARELEDEPLLRYYDAQIQVVGLGQYPVR